MAVAGRGVRQVIDMFRGFLQDIIEGLDIIQHKVYGRAETQAIAVEVKGRQDIAAVAATHVVE